MRSEHGQVETREVTRPNQVSPERFKNWGLYSDTCPAHLTGSHTKEPAGGKGGGFEKASSMNRLLEALLSPRPAQTLAWTI